MKIRIKESQELKNLIITGTNGIEWTNDLLGNNDALHYNKDTEEYEISQDEFNWWEEYINNHNADREEITAIAAELNIDESEIYDKVNQYITNDLGDEHGIKQNVIADFRREV